MTEMIGADRGAFDERLAALGIMGQWRIDEQLNAAPADGPRPLGEPCIWHWSTIRTALTEAAEILSDALRQRRSLLLVNPAFKSFASTGTFGVGIQLVAAGERAWAHRHTMAAIRFVIEGSPALSTVVDGQRFVMEPGDLILTPSLTWHDHHNDSGLDGIWLDAIDSPFVGAIGQRWYQPYGETLQPQSGNSPQHPYRFPWHTTQEALTAPNAPASPFDGVTYRFTDPTGAGPTLPTLGCAAHLLAPGLETQAHRHTSSSAYLVVEGTGTTLVGESELRWSERDVFVVPNWLPHRHVNGSSTTSAVLFSVTDEPLLRAIGLYREDPAQEAG
jgi:gentisate 1,2-dioxygenase/1-hydroxy-2-naphthoate dioxygenase